MEKRTKKPNLSEGEVFVLCVAGTFFVSGLIARVGRDRWSVVAYFFPYLYEEIPTVHSLPKLTPYHAVYIQQVTVHGFIENEWHAIGKLPDFERDQWPLPVTCNYEEDAKYSELRYFGDDPEFRTLQSARVPFEMKFMPRDSISGHIFVERILRFRLLPLSFQEPADWIERIMGGKEGALSTSGSRSKSHKPMSERRFWNLLAASAKIGPNCEDRCQYLTQKLSEQPLRSISAFQSRLQEKMQEAANWDLRGVAYLAQGGGSEDGFLYFLGWLILQGEGAFNEVCRDAEQVLSYLDRDTGPECEQLLGVAMEAAALREEEIGEDLALDTEIIFRTMKGQKWDEVDLPHRFPKVWALTQGN